MQDGGRVVIVAQRRRAGERSGGPGVLGLRQVGLHGERVPRGWLGFAGEGWDAQGKGLVGLRA